ncbi:MAG: serine hydrolase [Kangiellaceae bacterium]|nr:serine hydrolase [Kangiellaceae bacterium]
MRQSKLSYKFSIGRSIFAIVQGLLSFTGLAGEKSLEVDLFAEKTIKAFQIPGIALAVVQKGKVVHSQGYGVASIESSAKVDSNTIFKIASNSKAFTGAALAILVEQGKLNWQDKVIKYLPNFKMYDDSVTKEFNIIDLLTHRSGLRKGAGDLMLWPETTKFQRDDIVRNLRYLKPVSKFRKEYAYDNLLYIVAGRVIEKISGMTWEEFIHKNIFDSIGMNRCFAGGIDTSNVSNLVAPHALVDGKLKVLNANLINKNTSLMAPAGGVKCSATDLATWVKELLSINPVEKAKLQISSTQRDRLWHPVTPLPLSTTRQTLDGSTFHSYALGWRISDYFGHRKVSHTGMLGGSMSQIVIFPELELGIVILTNQQSGDGRNALLRTLLQAFVPVDKSIREDNDWVEFYLEKKKNRMSKKSTTIASKNHFVQQKIELSSANKARLGRYNDNWFGLITLTSNDGSISVRSEMSPRMKGKLYQDSQKRWFVKWDDRSFEADAWLDFNIDAKGRTRLTMRAISSSTDFSFDFEDLDFTKIQ